MENEAKGDEKEEKEGKSSKSGPLRADPDIWRRNEHFEAGKSLWNPFGRSRSTPQTRSRPWKMRKSMGSARGKQGKRLLDPGCGPSEQLRDGIWDDLRASRRHLGPSERAETRKISGKSTKSLQKQRKSINLSVFRSF
jgi:hypothetical protein